MSIAAQGGPDAGPGALSGPMSGAQPAVPAYVISLPRAAARRAQAAAEFARIGLPFAFVDGVDGRAERAALLRRADPAAWARAMGAPLSDGHLGCYAAHVGLWERIAREGPEIALICEDDVTFAPEFPAALAAGLACAGQWDILRFACIRAKGALPQRRIGPFTLAAFWGPFTGNACYLITRAAAARLAPRFWPIRRAHDHELNRIFAHDLRLMGLLPFAAAPRDAGESFITGTAMAGARKFPRHRRLPHYAEKLANYPRRLLWLARAGLLRPPRG